MTTPQLPTATGNPNQLCLNLRTLQLGGPHGWVDVSDPDCRLLKALADSQDQRIEAARMLEQVGKPENAAAKRALGVQLVRLRKKLEQAGAPHPIIKCIRGQGYQLCVSLTIHPSFTGQS